ncbi:tRNA N6-adenosine threonylcarbamoyltransferase, mitochondrial [Hylaeus anthracinus]|uniref:tRNA N6-adenosine threonylcarbamoyltransferase, mitochondrial n=1 Tax=Hylaeus anthracinus TaxID=313031 RepID=UPI0023BA3C47|nr:tRNA N6-adenosine threonylcarbamoyltransferase, mitochondrial [Hylaeus anthracinus]
MVWNVRLLFHKSLSKHFLYCNTLLYSQKHDLNLLRNLFHDRPAIVLGIESSCDETGCGIVDSTGIILGEAINSQHRIHLNYGGIIPSFARKMHAANITRICENALRVANIKLKDIDAVATTVKPGLPMSLDVGMRFGKYLAQIGKKPFIPIHHMEAHALTVRASEKVDFPYLVLLVSGGHCLLTIVENVDKFYLLGTSINNTPGEIFDKIARRLKLRNIPEFSTLNGGLAIETASRKASNVNQFLFESSMTKYYNCNFSFAGLLSACIRYIEREEKKHNVGADMLIPDVYNLCAAFQLAVVTHICQRTQRAMEFIDKMSLFPKDKQTLVVSGGVACNNFLANALSIVSAEFGYRFVRTPPKLCTDNGVMIAWNGIERWVTNRGVIRDPDEIEKLCIQSRAPLGEDWTEKVERANLKCKWVKIKKNLI